MTDSNRKGFLEKIRTLDRSAKRNVMIISTVIAMALVFSLWLVYFNSIVATVAFAPSAPVMEASGSLPAAQDGIGTSDMFSAAWTSFWESASRIWQSTTGAFMNVKQYNVTPKQ